MENEMVIMVVKDTTGLDKMLSGSEYSIEYSDWGEFPTVHNGRVILGTFGVGVSGNFIPPCTFYNRKEDLGEDCLIKLERSHRGPNKYSCIKAVYEKSNYWVDMAQFSCFMENISDEDNEKIAWATEHSAITHRVDGWILETDAAEELGKKLELYKSLGFKEALLEDYSFKCF